MESGPNPNPYLVHSGTIHSFALLIESTQKTMIVSFSSGETKKIKVKSGKSSILGACPSECGSVIYCLLKSGKEQFYDTLTGNQIPREDLIRKEVKFYA